MGFTSIGAVGSGRRFAQAAQAVKPLTDIKIANVDDGGLHSQGSAFIVILLKACPSVVVSREEMTASVMTRVRNK